MKNMTFKVAVIAFFSIIISQLVIGAILGVVWVFFDEYCTKIERNPFLRKVYYWLKSTDDHDFALSVCQMIIVAAVLSILSVIF